jgi:hypothetical protein
MQIAVGPAGGSVASAIARRLADNHRVVALLAAERGESLSGVHSTDHSPISETTEPGITLRRCDFFSRVATKQAIGQSDVVIFVTGGLAESTGRYPSELTQGEPVDMELNRADNVARAVHHADIDRVVCLQHHPFDDTTPDPAQLQRTFERSDSILTVLQCPMILGRHTPIITTLTRTLRRSPILLLPSWSDHAARPIYLNDLSDHIAGRIEATPSGADRVDLRGPTDITLRALLEKMRRHLDVMCKTIDIPVNAVGATCRWLSTISGVPRSDVRTWVHSWLAQTDDIDTGDAHVIQSETDIDEAISTCLQEPPADSDTDKASPDTAPTEASLAVRPLTSLDRQSRDHSPRTARSIQQLPLPAGRTAEWAALEYTEWLPGFFRPFMRVDIDDQRTCRFFFSFLPWPLLILRLDPDASTDSRQLFWVVGGLLARPHDHGRLEFREILDGRAMLACVHDFNPRLPWFIYRWTQALVHAWVMRRFKRHLQQTPPALESDGADSTDNESAPAEDASHRPD